MGKGVKTRKIVLNESGYFLSRKEGCFVVRNIRTKEEHACKKDVKQKMRKLLDKMEKAEGG